MKISIAHPNASYVEATRQVISVQDENYEPVGATSLEEVEQQLSNSEFDILLIDSELANGHPDVFEQTLKNVCQQCPTILTVSEDDSSLIDTATRVGVFEYVIKKKGYLSALSASIKRAVEYEPKVNTNMGPVMAIEPEMGPEIVPEIGPGPQPDPPVDMRTTPEPHLEPPVVMPSPEPLTQQDSDQIGPQPSNKLPSVQNGEIGYFVCDRKKRFLSVNHYIQKITGYSNEELLELSIDDILSTIDDSDFFSKLLSIAIKKPAMSFDVQVINNTGDKFPSKLQISLIYDDNNSNHIIGFRGNLALIRKATPQTAALTRHTIDQKQMISEVIDIIHRSYSESIDVLLKNMSELVCQIFGFNRSTFALLDPRKQAFVKQAMVGYSEQGTSTSSQNIEVPQKVINKVFSDNSRIKVIYHNKERRQLSSHLNNELVHNNSQETHPIPQWHKRDLIILNMADKQGNTFGYISLDDPIQGNPPTKSTFYNLELFSRLVSVTIENYYRISNLERRNRRIKQILVNSNVFKLYYSLSELLKEVVWSVKFSLDFNMVSLVLISKKSGMLETKAVACDDKIKLSQIRELKFNLAEYSKLLNKDYLKGKSYLVTNREPVFDHMKRIYYGTREEEEMYEGSWPSWAIVIVPIKSREEKIIGFLMADDPNDCRLPNNDTIHTLEILANQIAIAIDNRVMYVQAKEQIPAHQGQIQAAPEQPRIVHAQVKTAPVPEPDMPQAPLPGPENVLPQSSAPAPEQTVTQAPAPGPVSGPVQAPAPEPKPEPHVQQPAQDPTEVNDNIQDYQIEEIQPDDKDNGADEQGPQNNPFLANHDDELDQNSSVFNTPVNDQGPQQAQPQTPPVENFKNLSSSGDNSADLFADADFTKTGFKKLVERFLR